MLLTDNATAAKVIEACRRHGVNVFWTTSPEQIPLTVQAIVSSRREAVKPPPHLRTLYVEDYPSIECLILNLLAGSEPQKPRASLEVAIDPGQTIGVAYIADGYLVKTGTYTSLSSFENDCKTIINCMGEGRRIEFYIGYRPETITHELAARLKKLYPTAKITLIPDEGGGPEYKEMNPDEAAALKIYFKATSESI